MKKLFLTLLFTFGTFAQTQVAPTQLDARTQVKNVQPGLKGDPGTPGPAGLAWKRAWDNTVTYAKNDGVSFNGSSYISLVDSNLGNTPAVGSPQWDVLALGATSPVASIQRSQCVGSGNGTGTNPDGTTYMYSWNCAGLQLFTFNLFDGTKLGPYITIPAGTIATDPKWQPLALSAPDPH